MADVYIDNDTGDDTGAGTSGDPWKTLQKAFDTANAGDTIKVANTVVETPAASFDVSRFAGGASPTTVATPLHITVWDRGGSVTATMPDGSTVAAWGIDGGGSITDVFSAAGATSVRWFELYRGWIANFTADLELGTDAVMAECEVDTIGSVKTLNNHVEIDGCYIHDTTGDSLEITQADCTVSGCWVADCGGTKAIDISSSSNEARITGNLFTGSVTTAINVNRINAEVVGNTIDGATTAITILGRDGCTVKNNVITNATSGIKDNYSTTNSQLIGRNAFWTVTTPETLIGTVNSQPANVTEIADPYVDRAGGDWTLKSTALAATAGPLGGQLGAMPVAAGAGGSTIGAMISG